jgi:hypothetical protein
MASHDVTDLRNVDEGVQGRHQLVAWEPEYDLDTFGSQLPHQCRAAGHVGCRERQRRVVYPGARHLNIVSTLHLPLSRRSMVTTTTGRLDIQRQAGSLGAILTGVDLSEPVDADTFAAVHAAFLEHQVICLRGQSAMTTQDQLDFASRWGEIAIHTCRRSTATRGS